MNNLTIININGGGKKTARQSNIELLRIVAMLLVLLVHTNFFSIGIINSHQEVTTAPLQSFLRIELESLSLICVNLFVIISGYFGIRPKTKGVANLLFQVLFWRSALAILAIFTGDFAIGTAIKSLIPGIFAGDWFIPCYFMLMLVAPALNAYIDKADGRILLKFLIVFYALQTIFGWLLPYWPYYNGYSFISFIGLYILGRYIHLHLDQRIHNILTPGRGIVTYAILATTAACTLFAFLLLVKHAHLDDLCTNLFMRYSSPVNIAGAAVLLIAFTHLTFTNRIINRLAQSAFAVYIIHLDPFVVNYYKAACQWIYSHSNIWGYSSGVILFAIAVYMLCAMADSLRLYLWNILSRRFYSKNH